MSFAKLLWDNFLFYQIFWNLFDDLCNSNVYQNILMQPSNDQLFVAQGPVTSRSPSSVISELLAPKVFFFKTFPIMSEATQKGLFSAPCIAHGHKFLRESFELFSWSESENDNQFLTLYPARVPKTNQCCAKSNKDNSSPVVTDRTTLALIT